MNIIFSGGGTGGHIFPAISIAEQVRLNKPDSNIQFIGAKGRIEEKIVPENGFELITFELTGFGKNIIKNLKSVIRFLKAVNKIKKVIREFKPDVVVGTGGFASAPVIHSALKCKVPVLLQEGNAYPGKVTRYYSSKVTKVVINFKKAAEYLKSKNNIIYIAHPVRNIFMNKVNTKEIKESLGINNNLKTLFVFGGSQGSKIINDVVMNKLNDLIKLKINIIWQTGKNQYNEIKKSINDIKANIKIFEFINDINNIYAITDLALCRAGITSIMELSVTKTPAIFVPLSIAAENHQYENAKALETGNACVIITEKNLEKNLVNTIEKIIFDENKLNIMGNNIAEFSDADASKKIFFELEKILN